MFKEINAPSINELFVKQLKDMILSGELKAGDKLPPERTLAEQMKINRSVVSSGIRELVSSGFLKIKPRKGTYVTDYIKEGNIQTLVSIIEYSENKFDPKLMKSIYDVRAIHDCSSAELAAIYRTNEDITKLKTLVKAIDETNNIREKGELHFEFFRTLSFATDNVVYPLLMQEFKDLYIKLFIVLFEGGYINNRTINLRELIQTIENKDPEKARECALRIINSSTKSIEKRFNQYTE